MLVLVLMQLVFFKNLEQNKRFCLTQDYFLREILFFFLLMI